MLGLILPTSRYRPWPDAFATASDILYRDVPSVVVMRSNIVNRLSASHYYKHNCLHVFQWFRLTLLLRKCGSKCVNCLQLAIKSSLIARGESVCLAIACVIAAPHSCERRCHLFGLFRQAGTNAMTSCYRNRTVQVRPRQERARRMTHAAMTRALGGRSRTGSSESADCAEPAMTARCVDTLGGKS